MDIGSIFLILALLIVVVIFVSRPLFDRSQLEPTAGEGEHEFSHLMAERDRVLNALQELDFDHVLGKIPDDDYPSQRAVLLQRGAEVLRNLDEFQVQESDEDLEARIEAAIAARRADAAHKANLTEPVLALAGASGDDELELMLSNRRRARQEKAAGFCSQCGGPVQKSDRFCPKCGNSLT
jgi:rubrerythrin